jgi:hypothetical protein
MPAETWEDARDLGFLQSVLNAAVFAADTFPGDDGIIHRQNIKEELLTKLWGGLPGAPLGPNGTYRLEDLTALPLLTGGIVLNVARGGNPNTRRK